MRFGKRPETPDPYQGTIDRMEPDIASVDRGAHDASASISLRRIADALEKLVAMLAKSEQRKY